MSKYSINVQPSISPRFPTSYHLGEPIKIEWTAPVNHSRKDWIGIYRVGANKDQLVTRISSQGKWVPIHEEEFDGPRPIPERPNESVSNGVGSSSMPEISKGMAMFRGNSLPWNTGLYEIRYHHAGKHNVMTSCGPIEIFVDKPTDFNSFESVRNSLSRTVAFALDCDVNLVPPSTLCHLPQDQLDNIENNNNNNKNLSGDDDDMIIMNDNQAQRIANAISQCYNVDFTPGVIIADANLSRLSQRVLDTRRLLNIVEHRTPGVTQG